METTRMAEAAATTPGVPSLDQTLTPTTLSTSVYQPLDRERMEIRLLLLKPGSDSAPVECNLQHAFLADADPPEYEAISYCWGDPNERTEIWVNSTLLNVPISAEEALRGLRLPKDPRLLWIDAVCINQDDVEERGHQVGMMYEIYSFCARSLLWQGFDDTSMDVVTDTIEIILASANADRRDGHGLDQWIASGDPPNSSLSQSQSFVKQLETLISFYNHPWFTRLWVVQEAALPQESVCIRGKGQVSLKSALRAATWILRRREYFIDLKPHPPDRPNPLFHACLMWPLVVQYMSYLKASLCDHAMFFFMLKYALELDTSDPKDHVYGMLGLWRQLSERNELSPRLQPNYNKTLTEVYLDATRYCLENGAIGQVFRTISDAARVNDEHHILPSWGRTLFAVDSYRGPLVHELPIPLRTADDALTPYDTELPQFCEDDAVFSVSGFIVDSVDKMTATFQQEDIEEAKRFISDAESLLQTETLATVCIANYLNAHHENVNIRTHFDDWKAYIDTNSRFPEFPPAQEDLDPADSSQKAKQWRAGRYHEGFMRACRLRRVMVTSSAYGGLGPGSMQKGDIIAVLYGCAFPMVLRRDGDYYTVVGTCYIHGHGIMEGEAVRRHKESGGKDVVFRLR